MKKLTTRQLLIAVLVFDFVLFGALYISNTERQTNHWIGRYPNPVSNGSVNWQHLTAFIIMCQMEQVR